MRFCVVNLGCKVNKVESDDAAALLLSAGWRESAQDDADLILVNTCTVTGEAEKKTRKAVRHALRSSRASRIVVTGCAAAIDPSFFEQLDDRVLVAEKARYLELLSVEMERLASAPTSATTPALSPSPAPTSATTHAFSLLPETAQLRVGEGFRTRVGVKVQDGCDNACTYCIVHVARGKATSRPSREIVDECVAYAQAGVREIVLSGINIGSYCEGAKRDSDSLRIAGLLELLLEATKRFGEPPVRFRISSIEPCDVTDDLIDLMAASRGRICRHLHLPLQAGSSKVLREMARPYTAQEFEDLVAKMRASMPTLSLSTDIIVGFPGESEAEFQETLSMARTCAFSRIHVFPYSRREGTPAAARSDQVSPEVKARRAFELRALGEELAAADLRSRAGTEEWLLVESGDVAVTESYHEVPAPYDAAVGSLVRSTL